MNSWYRRFRNWCNLNSGVFTLVFGIVATIGLFKFNNINFEFAATFLDKLLAVLLFKVQIPFYLLIISMIVAGLYVFRLRKRYRVESISSKFLVGIWRNEWTIDGRVGTETIQITDDLRYLFLDGRHRFNLTDIHVDPSSGEVKFTKRGVHPDESRNLKNILTIRNNELLVGQEENYQIRYIRLPN